MQIDHLIRTKRKTVGLIVERDGRLVVRAPKRLPLSEIQRIVDTKSDWIEQKRLQFAKSRLPVKQYVEGEGFRYLGKEYLLRFTTKSRPKLQLSASYFWLSRSALPQAEKVFREWYRTQARKICTQRASEMSRELDVSFQRIRISSARTRWGSCSSRGTLSFTWRLVMAPLEIIDYVVLHELAHLREPNHSKRFWAIVEQYMPDYKQRRTWLKQHSIELS